MTASTLLLLAALACLLFAVCAMWRETRPAKSTERPFSGPLSGVNEVTAPPQPPGGAHGPLAGLYADRPLTWPGPVLPPETVARAEAVLRPYPWRPLPLLAARDATAWDDWHDARRRTQGPDDVAGTPWRAGE